MLSLLTDTPFPESTTRPYGWSRAWIACTLLLVACGGSSPLKSPDAAGGATGGGAAGSTAGAGGGAGVAGGGAAGAGSGGGGPCPSQPPIAASSCSVASLTCEYGADPNPYCRTYARCEQGQWQLDQLSTTLCPSTTATTCPATLEGARDVACAEKGSWCTWDPGTTCKCTDCRPGPVGDYYRKSDLALRTEPDGLPNRNSAGRLTVLWRSTLLHLWL
jgi:hypothetical protein